MTIITVALGYLLCIVLPVVALRVGQRGPLTMPLLVLLTYHALSVMFQGAATLNSIMPVFGLVGAYHIALRYAVAHGVIRQAAAVLALAGMFGWLLEGRATAFNGANAIGAVMVLVSSLYPSPVHIVGLIATLSRGAWVSLLGYIRSVRVLLLGAFVLVVGLSVLRLETVLDRTRTHAFSITQWSHSPLIGWGSGSYAVLNNGKEHSDSMPLTIAVEGGVLGLAVYAWVVWMLWSEPTARPMLVAVGIHGLVDYTLFWPWVAVFFGAILAIHSKARLETKIYTPS